MPAVTRIISDLHYGDRSSRIRQLVHLRPLLEGISGLVLNGDTLDTRPGPFPAHTAAIRSETLEFFAREAAAPVMLTGNHDADISARHALDLGEGKVFVVHGDILHETIVPWGRDGPHIGRLIAAELAALPPGQDTLEARLAIWRRVAAKIPQRHQSEPHGLKYALHFAADTVWPPLRVFRILRAWREEPARAAALLRQHRPDARFIVVGHTHRPGVHRMPGGLTVINTGSFCAPLGGYAVDVEPGRLLVRAVEVRNAGFHPGPALAEFPL